MLINVPTSKELNENALRFYFEAWGALVSIISNFRLEFDSEKLPWDSSSIWHDEWDDYVSHAQSELGAIVAITQQSAEVRLKSIICEINPLILLLKSDIKLKQTGGDLDFADQRTLDAVDLPSAVRTFTPFFLHQNYDNQYKELRRFRNRYLHTGITKDRLEPKELVSLLSKQYAALWPDGKWLSRRVAFDGNSAVSFFHDERYSSVHTLVMAELPVTIELFENSLFNKCFGTTKSSLKGHCPCCKSHMASKFDINNTQPTIVQNSASKARCLMCESTLLVSTFGFKPLVFRRACFSAGK